MANKVSFVLDDCEVIFETTETGGALKGATGEGVIGKAEKSFDDAIKILRKMSDKFCDAIFIDELEKAEIAMGLEVSAKGDFIVVGSNAECSINVKLILSQKNSP